MIIPLKKNEFSFLIRNLLGHDPIHDFKDAARVNKLETQKILEQISSKTTIPLSGGKQSRSLEKSLKLQDKELKDSIDSKSLQAIEDKVSQEDLDDLIKEYSLEILYLIGFLSNEEINQIVDEESNVEYRIISYAIDKYLLDFKKVAKGVSKKRKKTIKKNKKRKYKQTKVKRNQKGGVKDTIKTIDDFLNASEEVLNKITIEDLKDLKKDFKKNKEVYDEKKTEIDLRFKEILKNIKKTESKKLPEETFQEVKEEDKKDELQKEELEEEEQAEQAEQEEIQKQEEFLKLELKKDEELEREEAEALIEAEKIEKSSDLPTEPPISIEELGSKILKNEIVKLIARIGLQINIPTSGEDTLETKQIELLDNIKQEQANSGKLDDFLFDTCIKNYGLEEIKQTEETLNEMIENRILDREEKTSNIRYIINNAAIKIGNPGNKLQSRVIGCGPSIVDPGWVGSSVSDKLYPDSEKGYFMVNFVIEGQEDIFYKIELKYQPVDVPTGYKVVVSANIPYQPYSVEKGYGSSSQGRKAEFTSINFLCAQKIEEPSNVRSNPLNASNTYYRSLQYLLEFINKKGEKFDWGRLTNQKEFVKKFITSYHAKATPDFLQELTAILKNGGYNLDYTKISNRNPIYKFKGSNIDKYEHSRRVYLGADRVSAVRYIYLKRNLSNKYKNLLSYGGYYGPASNPNKMVLF